MFFIRDQFNYTVIGILTTQLNKWLQQKRHIVFIACLGSICYMVNTYDQTVIIKQIK